MKKLFICALVAGSLLMASCGGSSKKAEAYVKKLIELDDNRDTAATNLLSAEMLEYMKTLSEEELEKFESELYAEIDKHRKAIKIEDAYVEVDITVYHTVLAATEVAEAAKLVGEWWGVGGTLTLNKDGKFIHHMGHSATMPMIEKGSWYMDCGEGQKNLVLMYDSGDPVYYAVSGEKLEGVGDAEGESYTRL